VDEAVRLFLATAAEASGDEERPSPLAAKAHIRGPCLPGAAELKARAVED